MIVSTQCFADLINRQQTLWVQVSLLLEWYLIKVATVEQNRSLKFLLLARLLLVAVFFASLLLFFSKSAYAQTASLQPVDQAVGDLDTLSKSLRKMSVGLRLDGEQTSLFSLPANQRTPFSFLQGNYPHTGRSQVRLYYRIGPGFAAQMDRADYLVRRGEKGFAKNAIPQRDGEFYEFIPANTVFMLDPKVYDFFRRPTYYQTSKSNIFSLPAHSRRTNLSSNTRHYFTQSQTHRQRINHRLNYRIESRVNGRIDRRAN